MFKALLQEVKAEISGLPLWKKIIAIVILFCEFLSLIAFVVLFNVYSFVGAGALLFFDFLYCSMVKPNRKPFLFALWTHIKKKEQT